MPKCEGCELARTGMSGLYIATCRKCQARALRQSPAFFESKQSGKLTPAYQAALTAMGLTHEDVKAS